MAEFHKKSSRGKLTLWIAKRFIVNIESSNMPDDQFQKIGGEFPVKQIAALK